MSSPIILVGGGGHCASCIEVILSSDTYSIFGIIDGTDKLNEQVLGIPVIGSDAELLAFKESCEFALITVGFVKTSEIQIGYELPVIIANTAYKSVECEISNGTILMHQVMVNARASIGANCIINSKALIEHDATIGNNCHISTGAIVNGNCTIGDDCLIGSGSVIKHGVEIVSGCVIGAGAVVVSSITSPGVYVGNPVRKI